MMPDVDGYDLISELPPDGSRVKEVFARFGRTAYQAQVFDLGLVNLLCATKIMNAQMSRDQVDAAFAELFRKTSGVLVNSVSKENQLGSADLDLCRQAVAQRNRLIHHFFREHAEDFVTSDGQQLMIDDMANIGRLLEKADAACQRVTLKVGAPRGLTEEAIRREYHETLDRMGVNVSHPVRSHVAGARDSAVE